MSGDIYYFGFVTTREELESLDAASQGCKCIAFDANRGRQDACLYGFTYENGEWSKESILLGCLQ